MKTITAKDNPALKKARKLLKNKYRAELSSFLVEGRKLINEAVSAGFETELVFIDAGAHARGEAAVGEYPNEILLDEKLFRELAQTKTPQPYIAIVNRDLSWNGKGEDAAACSTKEPSQVLILDRISDPGNAGTLIRTALAAGIAEVWCLKGTADIFSDKCLRASAGAVFHIPVLEGLSAGECLGLLRDLKMRLFVCDAHGKNMYDTYMADNIAIAVGNESTGPQDEFLKAADQIIRVPMEDRSESLNAAVCGAVAMYEARRQRGEKG